MSLLDPKTVILLTGVMSGLMSFVLYGLKRSYPPSIQGLGEWSASLLVMFVGGLLVSSKGMLPDLVTISLSSLLLWLGLYLGYRGTQRFFGVAAHPTPWLSLIGAVLLVQVWFTLAEPDYRVRLILSTSLSALLTGAHAGCVLQQGRFTLARALTAWVLAAMSAIQLLRLATVSSLGLGSQFFGSDTIQLVYITSFAFALLLYSISIVLMATERLHTELQYQASHDSLTLALTRRRMNEACAQELERCHRYGRSMALLLIDLDHFKVVNDTYGHQGGDQALISFVNEVNALLRQPDLLGRLGGEEFLVLLPETTRDEAIAVAERIRETCARERPGPTCTTSIGVTTNLSVSDTMDTLLARADAAMYRAKHNGRNRVEAS